MQVLQNELLPMITSQLSPNEVINLSSTCRRFRLFYSPLLRYLKQFKHPEIFIQLQGLVQMLENIDQLQSHFPLCNSILCGYLSSLPDLWYFNHRIIIEMLLLRITRNTQHAYNILHLNHQNGLHPLIVSFITEKIKKIFGEHHSLEKVIVEIQENLNVKNIHYRVAYHQDIFVQWVLMKYIPIFYADLDMQHQYIAMCRIRDDLADKGPELNFAGSEFKMANLKLVALSHHKKDMKHTFTKSLIEPFTNEPSHYNVKYMDVDMADLIIRLSGVEYFSNLINKGITGLFNPTQLLLHLTNTSQQSAGKFLLLNNWEYFISSIVDECGLYDRCLSTIMTYIHDDPNLLIGLSRYFRQRFCKTSNIHEILGCYNVVLTIEKEKVNDELWTVLYDKILEKFKEGKQDTRWVYYPKLTSHQSLLLETKLIEFFADYVEDDPHVTRGLRENDWREIMEKTTHMEHKDLAKLRLEQYQIKKTKSTQQNSSELNQDKQEKIILAAERLIKRIVHHDSVIIEEKKTHLNTDMDFCEKITLFYRHYWFMKVRFFQDCYPSILSRIQKNLLDNKISSYDFDHKQGKALLALLFELFPDKFHDIVIDVIEFGSREAINKIAATLNFIYQKVPSEYIRIYSIKLYEYFLKNSAGAKDIDRNYGDVIDFLLHVIEYLSLEQQQSLSSINMRSKSLFIFVNDISTFVNPTLVEAFNPEL